MNIFSCFDINSFAFGHEDHQTTRFTLSLGSQSCALAYLISDLIHQTYTRFCAGIIFFKRYLDLFFQIKLHQENDIDTIKYTE